MTDESQDQASADAPNRLKPLRHMRRIRGNARVERDKDESSLVTFARCLRVVFVVPPAMMMLALILSIWMGVYGLINFFDAIKAKVRRSPGNGKTSAATPNDHSSENKA